MLTTRRHFLATAAGGLLLASAAAGAPADFDVQYIMPTGAVSVNASGPNLRFLVNTGHRSDQVVHVDPKTGELRVGQYVITHLKQTDTIRVSVATVGEGNRGGPPTVVSFVAGERPALVHKDAAGATLCRGTIVSHYDAPYKAVRLVFTRS